MVEIVESPYKNSRGEFVKHLVIDDVIWMSSGDDEYEDIERALKTANGDCLILGLGLGLIVQECEKLNCVNSILVYEISHEVIGLHSFGPKVTIKQADATKINELTKFDWIYFDIWLDPDLEAMQQCFDNAQSLLKPDGVVECWLKPRLINGSK